MPVYEYKALDAKGKNASGNIDADTARDAREKLRFQKIYVTEIIEVRGTTAKREVVKDQVSGEKRVVVSQTLPGVMQACAVMAFVAAGVEIIQLLMAWTHKDEVITIAGQVAADAPQITGMTLLAKAISAGATAMFGFAISRGRAWALWVTALFALLNFGPAFYKLLTENDYMQGLFGLLFGSLAALCVMAWAKFKDVGGSEGNDKISNLNEVSAVTRQLATLLHSGIPLAQSLSAVIEQAEAPGLQKVLRHLREQVSQGVDFASALESCPGYFNSLYVNMVRAGQASGQLDDVLSRVAEYLSNQNRMRNKVITAMMYPAIMLSVSILVVIALMTFVVPQITKILIEQKIPLPLPTLILVTVSDFMKTYWELCVKIPLIAYFFFQGALQTDAFRLKWDRGTLRFPLFGDLLKKTAIARFAITFAVLLRSGMPALDSLRIVKKIVGNRALQDVIQGIHDSILEGTDISTPIKKSGVFPPMVGYMIAVGEQTGELESLLERVATAYNEEVDISIARMTGLIEPIMIVLMAVVVGGIVAAVIIPMLQMSSQGAAGG